MKQEYTRETLLTTVDELRHKLGAPDLCIIDVRPAEDYAKGHIPGATHFDLFGLSLIDTSEAPLKAFMFMIHHVLELRGVSETKQVVFYEANSGMDAIFFRRSDHHSSVTASQIVNHVAIFEPREYQHSLDNLVRCRIKWRQLTACARAHLRP